MDPHRTPTTPATQAASQSNGASDTAAESAAEQRLTALEIKASYSEDLLEQLNLLVYRQQLQIDALAQQLQRLGQQLPEGGAGAALRNLRDELPPHY